MNELAVVTVCIGQKYELISELTHPTLKCYAERIGADFVVLSDDSFLIPHLAKFEIYSLLTKYKRILYIDSDIIVRKDCPNLFDIVSERKIGIFNEGKYIPERQFQLRDASVMYGMEIPKDWAGEYYNTGVMVLSRVHRKLFIPVNQEVFKQHFYEQSLLNLRILKHVSKDNIHELNYQFNRMSCMDVKTGQPRHASYMIHYAGAPSMDLMITLIRNDITEWNTNTEYNYKRNILIDVGGGMGDQIEAEPLVRYIIDVVAPGEVVAVFSAWPRIFKHLNIPVMKKSEFKTKHDMPYFIFNTAPEDKHVSHDKIAQTLMHPLDFSSLVTIRSTLPNKDKEIHLDVSVDDLSSLLSTCRIVFEQLKKFVVVHPGNGWPSKTFPKDWWDKVISELDERDVPVILIGADYEDRRGTVDVDVPDSVLDMRNILSESELYALLENAGVLLSNDSAPIHIAGAFDNQIVVIPTCKHADHILPYRNGTQSYKTHSLIGERLLRNDYNIKPFTTQHDSIDIVPEGHDIEEYIPDSVDVVDCVYNLWMREND